MSRALLSVGVLLFGALLVHGCSSDSGKPPTTAIWDFGDAAAAPEAKDPADLDGDGYTPAMGDCYEGSALINPGAFEYVGNDIDDDCDGIKDNGYEDCDEGSLDATNPFDIAKAMNICPARFLVNAEFKSPAKPEQRRIANNWGPNVPSRFGSTLVAISTGKALLPSEAGFVPTGSGTDMDVETPRPGPYATKKGCGTGSDPTVHDPADILLTLQAPTNAQAFSFEIRFFTAEYPQYYCTQFNDAFAAIMKSQKYNSKNIAYGSEGENLSVNVSFWAVCEDCAKYTGCKDDPKTIDGTGFGPADGAAHGATRWLTVTAPVIPGETFTLRLVVWDEGDGILDSTALLDSFKWDINAADFETTVEQPK